MLVIGRISRIDVTENLVFTVNQAHRDGRLDLRDQQDATCRLHREIWYARPGLTTDDLRRNDRGGFPTQPLGAQGSRGCAGNNDITCPGLALEIVTYQFVNGSSAARNGHEIRRSEVCTFQRIGYRVTPTGRTATAAGGRVGGPLHHQGQDGARIKRTSQAARAWQVLLDSLAICHRSRESATTGEEHQLVVNRQGGLAGSSAGALPGATGETSRMSRHSRSVGAAQRLAVRHRSTERTVANRLCQAE